MFSRLGVQLRNFILFEGKTRLFSGILVFYFVDCVMCEFSCFLVLSFLVGILWVKFSSLMRVDGQAKLVGDGRTWDLICFTSQNFLSITIMINH